MELVKQRDIHALMPWLEATKATALSGFAAHLAKDKDAILAALQLPWSQGQVEGQVQMYDPWREAVRVLRREDHYLLVLLAAPTGLSNPSLRDRLKLVGIALPIVLFIKVGIILFSSRR